MSIAERMSPPPLHWVAAIVIAFGASVGGCAEESDGVEPGGAENEQPGGDEQPGDGRGGGGSESGDGDTPDADECEAQTDSRVLRPGSNPSEYTGLSVVVPVSSIDVIENIDRLVGDRAAAGELLQDFEIQPGIFVSASADDRTSEQVILQVEMVVASDATPQRRTLFRGPASFAYGTTFIDVLEAAFEESNRQLADRGAQSFEPFVLEHRIRSANGGQLVLRVTNPANEPRVEIDVQTPRTSLKPGEVNQPFFEGDPWETLYGLVNFTLSRDQFDFFATRAYGITAGAGQNFEDFQLLPHRWLRLTVTPKLEDELVEVGFEVVTTDGRRLDVAKAPASIVGGEQFMQNVFRMVENMADQEDAEEGSSRTWRVPFYYDDPEGGGVVEVIAHGGGGDFKIAYAVETPVNRLMDVDFVEYQGSVEIPEDLEPVEVSCEDLGSEPALAGVFEMTFDASPTVRNSRNLTVPLDGPVWGSVFRAEDVLISGPIEGAESVCSFHFELVDLERDDGPRTFLFDECEVPAGEYQILGFMDIDDNADPESPGPDKGDPVFIPIGGYEMECAVQPVTLEFALLNP